jgi:hypothetical protein
MDDEPMALVSQVESGFDPDARELTLRVWDRVLRFPTGPLWYEFGPVLRFVPEWDISANTWLHEGVCYAIETLRVVYHGVCRLVNGILPENPYALFDEQWSWYNAPVVAPSAFRREASVARLCCQWNPAICTGCYGHIHLHSLVLVHEDAERDPFASEAFARCEAGAEGDLVLADSCIYLHGTQEAPACLYLQDCLVSVIPSEHSLSCGPFEHSPIILDSPRLSARLARVRVEPQQSAQHLGFCEALYSLICFQQSAVVDVCDGCPRPGGEGEIAQAEPPEISVAIGSSVALMACADPMRMSLLFSAESMLFQVFQWGSGQGRPGPWCSVHFTLRSADAALYVGCDGWSTFNHDDKSKVLLVMRFHRNMVVRWDGRVPGWPVPRPVPDCTVRELYKALDLRYGVSQYVGPFPPGSARELLLYRTKQHTKYRCVYDFPRLAA